MTGSQSFRRRLRLDRPAGVALAGAGLLALGVGAGAGVVAQTRPSATMAPALPVAIRSLTTAGIFTIRGRVAELFGDEFVVDDGSGRALVHAGPGSADRPLVAVGEAVAVQGRFDRGVMHAAFLVGPDRKVVALGPLGGPPHDPHAGPDHGSGAPPPPAPANDGGERPR